MRAQIGLRAAGILVICFAFGSTAALGAPMRPEMQEMQGTSDWTIMIYMAADVDTSLPWEQDINELEAAHQAEGTNVVVLLDPPGTGDSKILRIDHDENYFDPTIVSTVLDDEGAVIPGGGEVNTGSPGTLRDFIVFSSMLYPADNLVLVMWGHGAGWRGLCPDGYDLLTAPELRSALSMASETVGRGPDLLVLDVCIGASLELAYEIREYADILVASEVNVPSEGLPYMETMNDLASNPAQSVVDFAETIVQSYVEWAAYGSAFSSAMGVFDLGEVEGIVDNLNELSRLGLGHDRLYHEDSVAAVRSSEYSEEEWNLDVAGMAEGVCSSELPLEMKHAALLAATSLQTAVIRYETTLGGGTGDGVDVDRTYGLGLYAPSDDYHDENYAELQMAMGWWDEFSVSLHSARSNLPSDDGPILTTADSPSDSDLLPDYVTITWPTDPSLNYSSYAVHVFQVRPQGLVLCFDVTSTTHIIRVDNVIGNLQISASAYVGGEAHSHHTMNASLARLIGIDISIELGGHVPGRHLEVVTYLADGESVVTACLNRSCVVYLITPYQVDVGEIISVELTDADSGAVLAHRQVLMTGENVAVALTAQEPAADDTGTTLMISLIISLAVLGIAFVIYMNFLRRKP
jgi:hypothetical protein